MRKESPTLGEDLSLVLAVKGVHDTPGASELTPMILVFGVLPRMLIDPIDLSNKRERMRALNSARAQMGKIAVAARAREATNRSAL